MPIANRAAGIVALCDQLLTSRADFETAALARIAELEAFVAEIEIIETAWVTGVVSAQESMVALSEAWRKIRK